MAIFNPDQMFSHREGLASPLSKLFASLSPQSSSVLRHITHVLRPPLDAPRLLSVISAASCAVIVYRQTIVRPNETLLNLVSEIETLATEASILLTDDFHELNNPLLRRLSRYPAWALCLMLAKNREHETVLVAAGVEIALSYASGKPFPQGYANDIRRALERIVLQQSATSARDHRTIDFAFRKHFESATRNAGLLFESATSSTVDTTDKITFEERAVKYFIRNQQYADPNHRRAILDRRCQSPHQLLESSANQRQQAENGDGTSLLRIIAFCVGLSPELLMEMPLAGSAPPDWLMTLDTEAGLVKTNIDPLFPNAASPENSSIHRPANKIIVKPLPCFVASLLNDRFKISPNASTVGMLIGEASTSGKTTTITDSISGIAPSTKRFINSAAPFAIQLGLNRLVTAAVTNDFSVVPGAKAYYAQIEREEIWEASSTFFSSLGWGEPVPLVTGLAAGSLVAPERVALTALYQWVREEIIEAAPGKRYTLHSIVEFHNAYVKFCVTIAVLCLCARETRILRISASETRPGTAYINMYDKRTGQFPGALPVPINQLLKKQIKFWHSHCVSLNKRLIKLGVPNNSRLRVHLTQVIELAPVNLFFLISKDQIPVPIGSSDLTHWWPPHLNFNANFSRSFWQVELHKAGLKSSLIDMLVRHQLVGMESYTSTNNLIPRNCLDEICQAQELVLNDLGIKSIPGLSKK